MTDTPFPLEVPLTELQKYKLEALESRAAQVVESIRRPIVEKYAEAARVELAAALGSDPDALKARGLRDEAVNSTLAEIEEQLPEGYAVYLLSPETGLAHAKYDPEMRGKRLPVQG